MAISAYNDLETNITDIMVLRTEPFGAQDIRDILSACEQELVKRTLPLRMAWNEQDPRIQSAKKRLLEQWPELGVAIHTLLDVNIAIETVVRINEIHSEQVHG